MKLFRAQQTPFRPADAQSFVGAAQTKLLASDDDQVPLNLYHVRFESNARTNWHIHSGAQWLIITEGTIRVHCWNQPPCDRATGDVVVISPGEKHWHGAVPGGAGAHVAVNIDAATTWLEPVTDDEYLESAP